MSGDRYVVLGLARPRAEWFRRVGQWSTTAVVLIMALIGLAMWQLFDRVFANAGSEIESNVNQIG